MKFQHLLGKFYSHYPKTLKSLSSAVYDIMSSMRKIHLENEEG